MATKVHRRIIINDALMLEQHYSDPDKLQIVRLAPNGDSEVLTTLDERDMENLITFLEDWNID